MAVRRRQRQTYIEGNTVRKIQPLERQPKRRQGQEHRSRRRAKEKLHIQYVNIFYTVFLFTAAVMVLWSCVNYLQLQAETCLLYTSPSPRDA